MNLASLSQKQKDVRVKRDAALRKVESLEGEVDHMLLRHLREKTYQFYEVPLQKLECQFDTIQEFLASPANKQMNATDEHSEQTK